jgi:hypothetical protein
MLHTLVWSSLVEGQDRGASGGGELLLMAQDDRLRREPGISRMRPRCALPAQAEELTMEAEGWSAAGQGRGLVSMFGPCWPEVPRGADPSSWMPVV